MMNSDNHTPNQEPAASEPVLWLERLSKKFCRSLKRSLYYGVRDIMGELSGTRTERPELRPKEFWALHDVNLSLPPGRSLGLIGANGSGKTTLLRLITGLIRPDTGRVAVRGRVAPLIALGAGFSPVLTGRENIHVNMAILGVSRADIQRRFDAVVDFAEIGDAIDAPVQTYSSGMAARLGFASAIHTEPDILLIDEVLAVGDIRFRTKCYRRLAELRERGTTIILVSHTASRISEVCDEVLYLEKGHMRFHGETDEGLRMYENDLFKLGSELIGPSRMEFEPREAAQSAGIDITHLCFRTPEGRLLEQPVSGQPAVFCIGIKAHRAFDDVGAVLIIKESNQIGEGSINLDTVLGNSTFRVVPGTQELWAVMDFMALRPGVYTCQLNINKGQLYKFDAVESFRFTVGGSNRIRQSLFNQPVSWKLHAGEESALVSGQD